MSFVDFKEITTDNAGSTLRYGGNDFKEIMQMLNGAVLSNRRPRIATPWQWLNNTLYLMNPANTFSYTFETSAITADRKIILPALAADATLIVDNVANVFTSTAGQEMRALAAELLKLYRPEAGLTDIDISYYWNDSLGNKTRYSVLRSTPTNVTDGSETSRFDIFLLTNGSFVRNLRLLNTGDLTILTTGTTGYAFLGTGLTGIRNFTWPDLSGKVATDTNANIFSEKQTINRTAGGPIEEHLELKVTDDATSFFRIENATTSGATFIPAIRAEANNNATGNMFIINQCSPANDTGTMPLLLVDFRRNDGAAITTRPFLRARNAGGLVFEVAPTYFNFNGLNLRNATVASTVTGIVDANISAHTTTKITIADRALIPSVIAYEDGSSAPTGRSGGRRS